MFRFYLSVVYRGNIPWLKSPFPFLNQQPNHWLKTKKNPTIETTRSVAEIESPIDFCSRNKRDAFHGAFLFILSSCIWKNMFHGYMINDITSDSNSSHNFGFTAQNHPWLPAANIGKWVCLFVVLLYFLVSTYLSSCSSKMGTIPDGLGFF